MIREIAPWILSGSLGLNIVFLGLGAWAIARFGGWAALRNRIVHGQAQSDHQLHGMPYYQHRRSQLELLPVQSSDIVFLGDSLTDEGEWFDWFSDIPIRNRGISADTTTGILRRLDGILEGAPRKLFLMIGINDLVAQGKMPERVLTHYMQILQQIQERSPQTQIYTQSVLPISDRPHAVELNQRVVTLNQGLSRLAAQFGSIYLDLHSSFLENNQLSHTYTNDGVHLNGKGYALWVELIRDEIDPPS